jgi:hypothetical protein
VSRNDSNENLTARYQVIDKHSLTKMLCPARTAAMQPKKRQRSALSKYIRFLVAILLFPFLLVFFVYCLRLYWNIIRNVLQALLAMSKIFLLDAELSLRRDVASLIAVILIGLSPLYYFYVWKW